MFLLRLVVLAFWFLGIPGSVHAVGAGSQLIPCGLADTHVTVSASSHLDPSCTWTRGIEVVASDVTLDCQGARIVSSNRRYGIHIIAPTDVPLSDVTIRNCHVEGFLNSIHVERDGFRDLPAGVEYENSFSNIVVEDSSVRNSRGVGIYVNGYVTGVTLRRLHVEGTGSSGIYLETGSKDNIVEHNEIVNNGYRENGPGGQTFTFAGIPFWFWGPGREGVAIDGSRTNVVRDNYFSGNSAGGILLYKNCGEFPEADRYFERRYGSHGNVIEDNTFVDEDNGVWIGSRMGENTIPMNCTDPEYAPGYRLDHADDNVVRGNVFQNVIYGVRVEDDHAVVEDNSFVSADAAHVAVLLGTPQRTSILGLPVDGTRLRGNRAAIGDSKNPYRWVHGHVSTVFENNRSFERPVGLCEGAPPARGPFVMTTAFVPFDPDDPPTGDGPVLAPPEPLAPCPTACDDGTPVTSARLEMRGLATPAGDDVLVFKGRLSLPVPANPIVDPVETGVAFVVEDALGARIADLSIAGGEYDSNLRVGWRRLRSRAGWRHVDRRRPPTHGVHEVVLHDRSRHEPGSMHFRVKLRRSSVSLNDAVLPLTAFFILDPPTAETGQCGRATFPDPKCSRSPNRLTCRGDVG